jgi:hypothetical protein
MSSEQEDFELWLDILPDRVEEFKESLPTDISSQLDSSVNSLDIIEKYLLENFTLDTIREPSNASFYDGCARYIGDTFRCNVFGAYWTIEFKDKNSVFYNLPILMVENTDTFAICPLTMITALIDRQTGVFLSTITTNYQKEPRIQS